MESRKPGFPFSVKAKYTRYVKLRNRTFPSLNPVKNVATRGRYVKKRKKKFGKEMREKIGMEEIQ